MALITVNPMKSTTIGGVETLIREIQACSPDDEIIELYQRTPWQEDFEENENITYVNYGYSSGNNTLAKIFTKLKQLKTIASLKKNGVKHTIVLFHPNDLLYLPPKLRRESKVILVQTNRLDIFFGRNETFIMKLLSKHIDIFTVYTDLDKHRINKEYSGWFKNIVVIPRGCKLDTATSPSKISNRLVTIARLHEHQKNFSGMVEMMRHLPENYSLDIYGNGPVEELENLTLLIKDSKNISLKGSTSDVAATLSAYSVFIMTSHYEGFGQTLIEARSQGLPIVAYDTFDALSWIIEDGYNGYRVNPYDHKLFAECIEAICTDPIKYNTLSRHALEKSAETDRQIINKKWTETLSHG